MGEYLFNLLPSVVEAESICKLQNAIETLKGRHILVTDLEENCSIVKSIPILATILPIAMLLIVIYTIYYYIYYYTIYIIITLYYITIYYHSTYYY